MIGWPADLSLVSCERVVCGKHKLRAANRKVAKTASDRMRIADPPNRGQEAKETGRMPDLYGVRSFISALYAPIVPRLSRMMLVCRYFYVTGQLIELSGRQSLYSEISKRRPLNVRRTDLNEDLGPRRSFIV
jgi:hypothetical protein